MTVTDRVRRRHHDPGRVGQGLRAAQLSSEVTYLTYPAGDTLTIGPTEAYGTDVASAAAGATATASSGTASAAINGNPVGNGLGWTSASR